MDKKDKINNNGEINQSGDEASKGNAGNTMTPYSTNRPKQQYNIQFRFTEDFGATSS